MIIHVGQARFEYFNDGKEGPRNGHRKVNYQLSCRLFADWDLDNLATDRQLGPKYLWQFKWYFCNCVCVCVKCIDVKLSVAWWDLLLGRSSLLLYWGPIVCLEKWTIARGSICLESNDHGWNAERYFPTDENGDNPQTSPLAIPVKEDLRQRGRSRSFNLEIFHKGKTK